MTSWDQCPVCRRGVTELWSYAARYVYRCAKGHRWWTHDVLLPRGLR